MSDWQYRLFFSVDLENSTRYKSASSKPEELFVWSKNSPEASWERICTSRSIVLYSEKLFVDDFSKPFIKPFIYQDESKKCDEISQAAIRLKEKNDNLEEQTAYPEDTAVPESVDSSCENNGAIKNMREKFIK